MAAEDKFLDDIGDTAPAPEPAKEPEAKPAPEAPVKAEAEPAERPDPANAPERPDGYVPKQALEQTRSELKQAREHARILEDRTNKILERYFREDQPAKEEGPDPDVFPGEDWDLEGKINWLHARETKRIEASRQEQSQRGQQSQVGEVLDKVNARMEWAIKENPTVLEATNAWRQSVSQELTVAGYRGKALNEQINRLETQYALYAFQNELPIEDVMVQLATSRGFKPSAADAGKTDPTADAAEVKRDPNTGQFVSETEKAAKIKTSQERNGSLSSAPGSPIEKMTAKELASLSEDEMWRRFEGVKNSKGKKDFDRRMNFQ